MKFKQVLIANRGEIALRVIRALKEMNIESVLVYSVEDRDSLPVKLADRAICIGRGLPSDSYLNIPNIMTVATLLRVDAIHPGYGFLSENASFARVCEDYGIKFIGPKSTVLSMIKNKANVRKIAKELDAPILPGSVEPVNSVEEAKKIAADVGYPVMLKASLGGGGRGIRPIRNEQELTEQYPIAASESRASFGSDALYIEKLLDKPRHIEVQIIGDELGHIIHLGVRECSIQRNHQKIIEEAPASTLKKDKVKEIESDAVKLVKNIGYSNSGTVEFLFDGSNHYLLEINARIQVEHPVTEETTGVDIVKTQIKVASGEKLPFHQEDINQKGHAIEFRINAEDVTNNFKPSAGQIEFVLWPGGRNVRIDSHIYSGYSVPPFYDSLLAKIIVRGNSRKEAIEIGKRALSEMVIKGIETNIPLHLKILEDNDFVKGNIHTGFIEKFLNTEEAMK
jgi:acetyl-CoA carboxylase biotin carboxylase subunit